MKKSAYLLSLALLLVMCNKETELAFESLNGNKYTLNVERVVLSPKVQFPSDELQENDYDTATVNIQYEVTFSADGQEVTIDPGSIGGTKTKDDKDSKFYYLQEGLFAGGRFVVWVEDGALEAEYTVYGSGVPILASDRGKLEVVQQ